MNIKQTIFTILENALLVNPRYASNESEGVDPKLLRNKVAEDALKMDPELLKILLNNPPLKDKFFKEVNGILVFDKVEFNYVINNKQFLPDSYTRFKQKIGLIDSKGEYITEKNDVVLSFPYKDCVLEGGQTKEDQDKDEIFYNVTLAPDEVDCLLAPKVFTNAKRYTKDGVTDITEFNDDDNLLIKGNNLIVLASLLKRYEGKVKLIYIDPPYNTDNDSFNYNDSFNHSTWLTFMKNRLELAKRLLRDDGVICVQCDDNEQAYLKVLMDDIFGRDKFVANVVVKSNSISGNKTQHKDKTILQNKNSLLIFKKNEQLLIKPQYSVKDKWDTHYNKVLLNENNNLGFINIKDYLIKNEIIKQNERITENLWNDIKFKEFIINNRDKIFRLVNSIPSDLKDLSLENKDKIVFTSDKSGNVLYAYNGKRISFIDKSILTINGQKELVQLLGDLWVDIDFQNTQNQGGVDFANAKKPEMLLKRIIEMFTSDNDIILDYFSGSATTAAVALKLNRKFIVAEQMNYINTVTNQRLLNTIKGEEGGISKEVNWKGGGSFVYCELKELNNAFTRQILEPNVSSETLDTLYETIGNSEFISTKINPQDLFGSELKSDFHNLSIQEKQNFLLRLLDLNMLYVNYSDIDDKEYSISENDKLFTRSFYED